MTAVCLICDRWFKAKEARHQPSGEADGVLMGTALPGSGGRFRVGLCSLRWATEWSRRGLRREVR